MSRGAQECKLQPSQRNNPPSAPGGPAQGILGPRKAGRHHLGVLSIPNPRLKPGSPKGDPPHAPGNHPPTLQMVKTGAARLRPGGRRQVGVPHECGEAQCPRARTRTCTTGTRTPRLKCEVLISFSLKLFEQI